MNKTDFPLFLTFRTGWWVQCMGTNPTSLAYFRTATYLVTKWVYLKHRTVSNFERRYQTLRTQLFSTHSNYNLFDLPWKENHFFLLPSNRTILDMTILTASPLLPFTKTIDELRELYNELTIRYNEMSKKSIELYRAIVLSEITKIEISQYEESLSGQKRMASNLHALLLREKIPVDNFIRAQNKCHNHELVLITVCTCTNGKTFQKMRKALNVCLTLAEKIIEGCDRVKQNLGAILQPVSRSQDEHISIYIPDISHRGDLDRFFEVLRTMISDGREIPRTLEENEQSS